MTAYETENLVAYVGGRTMVSYDLMESVTAEIQAMSMADLLHAFPALAQLLREYGDLGATLKGGER